jgi:hypothetical protein
MKYISKIGPMYLLNIKAIIERLHGEITVYIFHFDNHEMLAVTGLHSFVRIDGQPIRVMDLRIGDRIWVDVHAFMADGSFITKKKAANVSSSKALE